ncbi:MAG: DUF4129 domain-containing protein [Streptosporangiales bacterium]|nr:DUF4129 domain-containing protein [Streptosporangiales bacterium]
MRATAHVRAVLVALVVAALVGVVAYAASSGAPVTSSPLPTVDVAESRAPSGVEPPQRPPIRPFEGGLFTAALVGIAAVAAAPIVYVLVRLVLLLTRVCRRTDLIGDSLAGEAIELRGGEVLPPAEQAERLLAGADAGLAELDAPDARGALIECWARLEQAAAGLGMPRRPEETATDLAVRILAERRAPEPAVRRLLALYHEARYSTHPVDAAERTAARWCSPTSALRSTGRAHDCQGAHEDRRRHRRGDGVRRVPGRGGGTRGVAARRPPAVPARSVGLAGDRRDPVPVEPVVGQLAEWPHNRAFARVDHISELLDFARTGTRHFEFGVRPILVDLVDDRLRRHHGVDRRRQPEQAHAIMGEDLWSLVTTEQPESPSATQLRGWVTAIERL